MLAKLLSARPLSIDLGLLLVRVGIGTIMATLHGWGKIQGGPALWSRIGGAMAEVGVTFLPAFWGFCAAFAEFGCSILIGLGLFFRPATALLAFTMLVAALRHLGLPAENENSGWSGASHALEYLCVYLALFFTGPGKWSLALRRR